MRALTFLALVACGDDTMAVPDAAPLEPDAMIECDRSRTPDPDPAFEALLVRLEQRMMSESVPGLGFAVLDSGTVVKRATLGKRESGSCDPFTTKTRIRLGRPARTLVSVATLVAAAEGKLSLDAPVTSYLTGFHVTNGDASAITIRMLLEHSAGLYVPRFMSQCPAQDLVGYWSSVDASLEFAPGAALASYDEELSLLGAVLSSVYAMPYRDVIQGKLFAPLGMAATYDHEAFLLGEHGRGGVQLEDPPPCAAWEPVHQVYVSLDDMIALATFLTVGNPAVLSSADLALVHDAGARFFAKEYSTGYGLQSLPYDVDGTRLYFTDGDVARTGGEIDYFADGFTVVFLENQGSCTYCFTDVIIEALSSHRFHEWLTPLPVTRFGEYVGTWVDTVSQPARTLTIAFDGDTLEGTYNGLAATFSPWGEDSFEVALFGHSDRVRFWRDGDDTPQILTNQLGNLGAAFHRAP